MNDRPSHFVSCWKLPGPCCSSCHDDEDMGYGNLYIENADIGPSLFVGVRYCCIGKDPVEHRLERLTTKFGGTGRRW